MSDVLLRKVIRKYNRYKSLNYSIKHSDYNSCPELTAALNEMFPKNPLK